MDYAPIHYNLNLRHWSYKCNALLECEWECVDPILNWSRTFWLKPPVAQWCTVWYTHQGCRENHLKSSTVENNWSHIAINYSISALFCFILHFDECYPVWELYACYYLGVLLSTLFSPVILRNKYAEWVAIFRPSNALGIYCNKDTFSRYLPVPLLVIIPQRRHRNPAWCSLSLRNLQAHMLTLVSYSCINSGSMDLYIS